MAKLACTECEWHGEDTEVLRAPNPFADDDDEEMFGCPNCRSPDSMTVACDEPGCWEKVTCGTPTPAGYRSTCGEHRPRAND